MYTLFKVFTIEGWFEVPDAIAAESTRGVWYVWAVKAYFVVAVLCGGLLGLSLANAVFVDEMTADNTRRVEAQVAELADEIRGYRAETERLRRALRQAPISPGASPEAPNANGGPHPEARPADAGPADETD